MMIFFNHPNLDIPARLDEFRSLQNGWLEGGGLAPNHHGLDWLSLSFGHHYPDDLTLPYFYPTGEGGIRVEWTFGMNEISLEINLETHQGNWHKLNLVTDSDEEDILYLDEDTGWERIITHIRSMEGNEV